MTVNAILDFDKKNFGIRLKALRIKSNVYANVVAEQIGITKQAYSLLEKGENSPGLPTLIALAKYFGVTEGYLLGSEMRKITEGERHCYICGVDVVATAASDYDEDSGLWSICPKCGAYFCPKCFKLHDINTNGCPCCQNGEPRKT